MALADKKVKAISVGQRHMAAVTDDGNVYTWGDGMGGRLGHGNIDDQTKPKQVMALDTSHVVDVGCGGHHTAVVTTNHEVFVWGHGLHGRAGVESRSDLLPELINGLQAIQVECGDGHIVALSPSGVVYTWVPYSLSCLCFVLCE